MGSRRHAAALNLMYESEQRKCSGYEIILCVLGHETILILDTFLQMKVRFCVVIVTGTERMEMHVGAGSRLNLTAVVQSWSAVEERVGAGPDVQEE